MLNPNRLTVRRAVRGAMYSVPRTNSKSYAGSTNKSEEIFWLGVSFGIAVLLVIIF